MSFIELKNITKNFGDKRVLSHIDMSIEKGEFVTLLGPSGCGKSTLLRIIVGLEKPDLGSVILNNQDITHVHPKDRKMSMIFQSYNLFPSMTVFENIAYSLKIRKESQEVINTKVHHIASSLKMTDHLHKYPIQLSGGEKQRVALARGMLMEPEILLLDEPFSAIDAKMRKDLQKDLRSLHDRNNMTTIFVTHDQEEAMRISDTIYVMNDGDIEQFGSPYDIYLRPRTSFVVDFIGNYNLISQEVAKSNFDINQDIALRPEVISIVEEETDSSDFCNSLCTIKNVIMKGNVVSYTTVNEHGLCLKIDSILNSHEDILKIGDKVLVEINKQDFVILDQ